METTHTHDHEHHGHTTNNDVKNFYLFIGIIAFSIIVLQPLAMLAVIFINAIAQQ